MFYNNIFSTENRANLCSGIDNAYCWAFVILIESHTTSHIIVSLAKNY
jgi:hypothetical protein